MTWTGPLYRNSRTINGSVSPFVGYEYSFTADADTGFVLDKLIDVSGPLVGAELVFDGTDTPTSITPVFSTKDRIPHAIGGAALTDSAIILPDMPFIVVTGGLYVSFGETTNIGHGAKGMLILNFGI